MQVDEFAKNLSHKLHANQKRNDGVTPYTVHTDYVGENAPKFLVTGYPEGPSPRAIMLARSVGFLHDAIEDQISEQELRALGKEEYGFDWVCIVNAVVLLSRMSKEDSIIDYLDGIQRNLYSMCAKLADLEHNMSDLKAGNLRDKYMLCRHYLIGNNEINSL